LNTISAFTPIVLLKIHKKVNETNGKGPALRDSDVTLCNSKIITIILLLII